MGFFYPKYAKNMRSMKCVFALYAESLLLCKWALFGAVVGLLVGNAKTRRPNLQEQ